MCFTLAEQKQKQELGNPNKSCSSSSNGSWSKKLQSLFDGVEENARKGAEMIGLQSTSMASVQQNLDGKILFRYEYKSKGRLCELTLAHTNCVWVIRNDSDILCLQSHNNSTFKKFFTSVDFDIPEDKAPAKAMMSMEWCPYATKWKYKLSVNGVFVPPSWSKADGFVRGFPGLGAPQI